MNAKTTADSGSRSQFPGAALYWMYMMALATALGGNLLLRMGAEAGWFSPWVRTVVGVLSVLPLVWTAIRFWHLLRHKTDEMIQRIRQLYGLDQPFLVQYWNWLNRVLHGDLSRSLMSGESVGLLIMQSLPKTMLIVVLSLILSLAIGVPLGVLAATRAHTRADTVVSAISSLGAMSGAPAPYVLPGGRDDAPPTSITSAPSARIRSACSIAASSATKRPPSLNESGVTLSTPQISTGALMGPPDGTRTGRHARFA